MTKRTPAPAIGGMYCNAIFIPSHVVPQIRHMPAYARTTATRRAHMRKMPKCVRSWGAFAAASRRWPARGACRADR